MIENLFHIVLRVGLLVVFAVPATVASGQGSAPASAAWPDSDVAFVRLVVAAANLGVQMNRIAALRATSDQVRSFAANSADDYSRLRRKLKELAWSRNFDVNDSLDNHQVQRLLLLQRHTGDEFDREYLTMQVDQTKQTLRLLTDQAQNAGNDDLRSLAQSKVSQVEARLKLAQNLADSR